VRARWRVVVAALDGGRLAKRRDRRDAPVHAAVWNGSLS